MEGWLAEEDTNRGMKGGHKKNRKKEGRRSGREKRKSWKEEGCLGCHTEETLWVHRYDLFFVDRFGHQKLLICFAKAVYVYVCSV